MLGSKDEIRKDDAEGISSMGWIAGIAGVGLAAGGGGSSSSATTTAADYETTEYNSQYGLGNINASTSYQRGYTGSGVKVSVLDTTFDTDHPDLVGVFETGYDASTGGTGVTCTGTCTTSHGTHVAGIIAANKNSTGMHGLAYEAKIKPISIFNSSGVSDTTISQLVNAINAGSGSSYAAMNNSWGTISVGQSNFGGSIGTKWRRTPGQSSAATSVQNALDTASGNTVIVFAHGNEGWNSATGQVAYYNSSSDATNLTNRVGYASVSVNASGTYGFLPASKTSLQGKYLTVIALDSSNTIASYSNGCGSVAKAWCIAAPGSSIYSTIDLSDTSRSGSYDTLNGTSMAAPHVTASIAILKQQFPNLTSTQLVSLLISTATDLGDAGVDNVYGVGMINLASATVPSGMSYIAANNANILQATTENTYIKSSSIFGNAFKDSQLKVGILDSYNRAYVWEPTVTNSFAKRLSANDYINQFARKNPTQVSIGSNSSVSFMSDNSKLNNYNDLNFSYEGNNLAISMKMIKDKEIYYLVDQEKKSLPFFSNIYSNFDSISQYSNGWLLSNNVNLFSSISTGKTVNDKKVNEVSINSTFASETFIGKVSVGNIFEKDNFLGASFSGAYELSDSSKSTFINLSTENKISNIMSFSTNYLKMISNGNFKNSTFVNMSEIKSDALEIMFLGKNIVEQKDKISLSYKMPLAAYSGFMNQSTVEGYTSEGDYNSVNKNYSLINENRQKSISLNYKSDLEQKISFFSTIHLSENLDNLKGNDDFGILSGFKMKF
ncbi:S8 family serine peptidase [Alphaproteobacteria bacterium]|nr:S8 family serine peptidase [Alphaproteobacteria bacterium]